MQFDAQVLHDLSSRNIVVIIRNKEDFELREFYPEGALERQVRIPIDYSPQEPILSSYYSHSILARLLGMFELSPILDANLRRAFYVMGVPYLERLKIAREISRLI